MTTLTEVAKAAGVSAATASRAFSEPGRVAAATLARVHRAAKELGYSTSPANKAVRTIGLVVPDITNALYGALIKTVHDRSWQGRHRVVLCETGEDLRREREQIACARELDGLILGSPRLPLDELKELLGPATCVAVNRSIPGIPAVMFDTETGIRQAIEHLVALGHQHISYAAGPRHSWADEQRCAAAAQECAQRGIQFSRLGPNAATIQGGKAVAATLLSRGATAVIAFNDLVALGVQAGLSAMGKQCPDDMSIIGVDDIDLAAAIQPGLSSVQIAVERGGILATDMLLEMIADAGSAAAAEVEIVQLDSQLIVRGTTAPPRQ